MNPYTIIDVIRDLVTGKLKFANRSMTQTRQNLCASCEVRNVKTNVCTACGCWLPIKIKLKKSSCPLEFW